MGNSGLGNTHLTESTHTMGMVKHVASVGLWVVLVATMRAEEPFQPWIKKGRVIAPGFAGDQSKGRLSAPCVIKLNDGQLRMYFWTTNSSGSRLHYLFAAEASPDNPMKWELLGDRPLLGPATSGKVRDKGPSFPWVLPREDAPWLMYYCAWGSWARAGELSNRTSLAISEDQGRTWKVVKEPLLALGPPGSFDAGMTGSVCVLRFGPADYRMWYTAGERYEILEGRKRGIVHLGYATSRDGASWRRHPKPHLSPRLDRTRPYEAVVSKPSVFVLNGVFHMWLSVSGLSGYRLAYARSEDGVTWQRALDQEILPLTPGGFDSVNQSYPNVIEVNDELWMFYVGNSFGSTGIGWATMKKSALE